MDFSGDGAGVGAESSIIVRLRLQQKSTAPGGYETLQVGRYFIIIIYTPLTEL